MDYLKSKMVKSESLSSLEEEESEDEAVSCGGESGAEEEAPGAAPNQQDRGKPVAGPEQGAPSGNEIPGAARAEVCVVGCTVTLGRWWEEGGQLSSFSLTFPEGSSAAQRPAFSSQPCPVLAV